MEIYPHKSWAEQWHWFAHEHERLDAVARTLEAGRPVIFAEMLNELKKMSALEERKFVKSQAEDEVLTSQHYKDYLRRMHDARHKANMARIEKETIKMKFSEWMCSNASARDQMKFAMHADT